jgi:CBS domain-containing protein
MPSRKWLKKTLGRWRWLALMEGDELVGIITERHYARNVVLKGKTSPAIRVRDIMERHIVVAQQNNPLTNVWPS